MHDPAVVRRQFADVLPQARRTPRGADDVGRNARPHDVGVSAGGWFGVSMVDCAWVLGCSGHGASASIARRAVASGRCDSTGPGPALVADDPPPSLVGPSVAVENVSVSTGSLPRLHRVVMACALWRCAWRGLSLGLWVVPLASTSWRSRRSIGSWSRPSEPRKGHPSWLVGAKAPKMADLCPFSPRSRCFSLHTSSPRTQGEDMKRSAAHTEPGSDRQADVVARAATEAARRGETTSSGG